MGKEKEFLGEHAMQVGILDASSRDR